MISEASAEVLREGLHDAHWTTSDLWIASIGIGGAFTQAEIQDIVDGLWDATELQHNILAAALNDHFTGQGENHPVRYWQDLTSEP